MAVDRNKLTRLWDSYPTTASIEAARPSLSAAARERLMARAADLLEQNRAVLVAHYYTHADLQELAECTGGTVADSLEMARFGAEHPASTLVVAGVRFMGETAKILSPHKRVLMPRLDATCSLDEGCPADDFRAFRAQYPDHTIVVYANTSAAVKAQSDWVVTSSIALRLIADLDERGEKILWAPDRHLGNYVQRASGAEMVLWPGSCIVHDEFRAQDLRELKLKHPQAAVLVHPESPAEVIELADAVGSTTQLLNASKELQNSMFIVATDKGLFYKMRQASPHKSFIEAPTRGAGATCKSCAHCPWMAMNDLQSLISALERQNTEIHIEASIQEAALKPVERMVAFGKEIGATALASDI